MRYEIYIVDYFNTPSHLRKRRAWYNSNLKAIFISYDLSEKTVEGDLNHEVMHWILDEFIDYNTSYCLDNINEKWFGEWLKSVNQTN